MADTQRHDTAALQTCADQYKHSLDVLKDSARTFQTALDALENDWTGRAFNIMKGKVALMLSNITSSYNKLIDAMDELTEIKNIDEETETNLAKMHNALSTGEADQHSNPFNG